MELDQNIQPNNLNTFRILYLIKGVLSVFGALFFLAYAAFGSYVFNEIAANQPKDLPINMASIFVIIGVVGFAISLILGVLSFLASKYLREQRKYQFIFVVAILSCLSGLLGILLGVFTLIELSKPHVKALFDRAVL